MLPKTAPRAPTAASMEAASPPAASTSTVAGAGSSGYGAAESDLSNDADGPVVCGLVNLGNTCFANSAIQVLTSCSQVVAALRLAPGRALADDEMQHQFRLLTRFSNVRQTLWAQATSTFNAMQFGSEPQLAPRGLMNAVGLLNDQFANGPGEQHDAAEWLSTLVDGLDDMYQTEWHAGPFAAAFAATAATSSSPLSAGAAVATAATAGSSETFGSAIRVAATLAAIDHENDAEELRLKRASNPHATRSGYAPPRLHRSPVGDVFRGILVSTVTCDTCKASSRTASEFTSLQLAFPTNAEREAYARTKAEEEEAAAEVRRRAHQQHQQQQPFAQHGSSNRRHHVEDDSHMSPQNNSTVLSGSGAVGADGANASESPSGDSVSSLQRKQQQHGSGGNGKAGSVKRRSGILGAIASAIARFCSALVAAMRYLWCCIGGGCCRDYGPLTLGELLWAHSRPERLTGANKYRCSSSRCGGAMRDATKTVRILQFPEVLVLQLKRFDHGKYWTSKISDHVSFPLNFAAMPDASGAVRLDGRDSRQQQQQQQQQSGGLRHGHLPPHLMTAVTADGETPALDMRPYAYTATTASPPGGGVPVSPTSAVAAATFSSTAAAAGGGSVGPFPSDHFGVTTFSLSGVVNHHGTMFGGHYTAYCYREEPDDDGGMSNGGGVADNGGSPSRSVWVLHNDHRAASAAPKEVASSQAYILVYRKRAIIDSRTALPTDTERADARRFLRIAKHDYSRDDLLFVPRTWLIRLATFAEPGPIPCRPCYCNEERRRTYCAVHGSEVPDSVLPPVEHSSSSTEQTGEEARNAASIVDRSNRHFHLPVKWSYVPVPPGVALDWARKYGTVGALVDRPAFLAMAQMEARWLGAIERARMPARHHSSP